MEQTTPSPPSHMSSSKAQISKSRFNHIPMLPGPASLLLLRSLHPLVSPSLSPASPYPGVRHGRHAGTRKQQLSS